MAAMLRALIGGSDAIIGAMLETDLSVADEQLPGFAK